MAKVLDGNYRDLSIHDLTRRSTDLGRIAA